MTKNTSKWKGERPTSDIGTLKYPYTILAGNDVPVGTVANFAEAEALLEYLVGVYVTPELMPAFLTMSANRKLWNAWTQKAEREATALRQKTKREERFRNKEDERARRLAARLQEELVEWKERKQADYARLSRQLNALATSLDQGAHSFTDEFYDHVGQSISRLSALLGVMKNHHFGVTSSKLFSVADHQAKESDDGRQ